MSIAFQAASAAVTGTATSGTITWPGSPSNQMLIAVFAFDAVTVGPFVKDSGTSGGWSRAFSQAPSASGTGIEVWASTPWSSDATTTFNFFASETFVAQGIVYTGQFQGDAVRATSSQAWTGANPQTPAIFSFAGEMLVAVAGDTLAAGGFGTPTPGGSTSRFDSTLAGAGTAELTAADRLTAVDGVIGPFTWTATGSPVGAHGAAGVLAIKPPPTVVTNPAVMEASMPQLLDLPDGYRLVWDAIDINGSPVAGVVVNSVSVFGTLLGTGTGSGDTTLGPFMLVPGPGA
jgi:hypothetical protein